MGFRIAEPRPPKVIPALVGRHIGLAHAVNELAAVGRKDRRSHAVETHKGIGREGHGQSGLTGYEAMHQDDCSN